MSKSNPPAARYAEIAGTSDEAVSSKTGMSWKQWVQELDAVKANRWTHREIAKHIGANYEVSGWWQQMVTVAYERIRGLREVGQGCDGDFKANKSKTYPVPISKLYKAFSTKRTRDRWLADVALEIRTSTVDKSMRISWPDGTSVHAYFTAKGAGKSQVAIQHVGLAKKAEIDKRKGYWGERLAALAETL